LGVLSAASIALVFILAAAPDSFAEYIIYLKGGHYIMADTCTFLARQEIAKEPDAERESDFVEECTKGKPEGPILWSTVDGRFGEVDADNVYAIYGTKRLGKKIAPRWTLPLEEHPLEDYVITNRDESFVNAKIYQEKDTTVYGLKRDELAKIDRRGVSDIVREGEAKARSGEGLCRGEPAEFSVTETELVGTNLVGVVTNLSKALWKPRIDVEVQVKGRRLGKFEVEDSSILPPDDSILIDFPVPARFLKHVERLSDPDASVRICYRKVRTGARQPVAGQPPTAQPPK
jgi:hypothetical protein